MTTKKLVAIAAGAGVAAKRFGILDGGFSVAAFPSVSLDSVLDTYAPLAATALVIIPNLNIPHKKFLVAAGFGALAYVTLIKNQQTSFTRDNILLGYLPLAAAILAVMKTPG